MDLNRMDIGSPKETAQAYRFFSTHIFQEGDEVSCEAIAIGDYKVAVGQSVLRDVAALKELARYWKSQLELPVRRRQDYDERFQTFIHVAGRRVPVDHLCVEIRGVRVRIDFTGFGMYVQTSRRPGWTLVAKRHKAFRLFASAIRQAALDRR